MNQIYFFFFAILLSFGACKKLPNNGVPSYIKLLEPKLITTTGQGDAVHTLKDIWIEADGYNLGAYETPLTFAAYWAGEKKVICNAGIAYNGNNIERRIYPPLEPYIATYNFVQKDTVEIQATFKYRDAVNFIFIEDFEGTNNFKNTLRTDLNSPENQIGKAGLVTLSSNENTKTIETISPLAISSGKRVFLELSLKSENYGGFGFKSANNSSISKSLAIFPPFEKWSTVYFEITNFINTTKEGEYHFYMELQRDEETGDSKTYIDNFKILQF